MTRIPAALAAFAALALSTAAAHAAETLPPVESFFRLPQYAAMSISPDGKHIAALAPVNGRQNLVILDVPPKEARAVTSFEGRDVEWFWWLDDKRLIFQTGSRGIEAFNARGGALFAVDADGSSPRQLSESYDERLTQGERAVFRALRYIRRLPGNTGEFIGQEIAYDEHGGTPESLARVDSRTGRRTPIVISKPDSGESERWIVDNHAVARALVVEGEGRTRIYYRASADAEWQKLDEFPSTKTRWFPLAIAEDDATLYTSSSVGRDKAAIVRYDPAKRAFGEVLAAHPRVDLWSLILNNDDSVAGVRFSADHDGEAMFDPELARLQKAVDGAFPDAVNTMSWTNDRSLILIFSYSDVSPGTFYLMDVKKGQIRFLADRAPWIKPAQMSHMTPVRYAARDGLEIPAYLTLPRGSAGKNLPLIVDVHGGPWVVGDRWRFDPEAQFFASRGYAVLQPNYRGTVRYGRKHYEASFGQWGLSMQEDIEDGVKWAIARGIADPKRVCIYGASYGGYAVMMGLAKTPDLYRCGVDYVGVTDLRLFLTMTWADYSQSDFVVYDAKTMVGDPDRDSKRLAETSPVNLASHIKAAVMMAYGGFDFRVPIEHGTRMKAALDTAGVKYEWMMMGGEGHGFRDPKNQKAFYEAVEKFFAENLAPK